jgi:hypothetical protein
MMKAIASALLAASLLFAAGAVRADDATKEEVKSGANQAGKTAAHGATAVGKGASRVYHTTASGVHKLIAKNSKSSHSKAVHQSKALKHNLDADRKTHQSEKELDQAKDHADQVAPK